MSYFVKIHDKIINIKYVRNIEHWLGNIRVNFEGTGEYMLIEVKNGKEFDDIMEELTKVCFDYNEKISKNS